MGPIEQAVRSDLQEDAAPLAEIAYALAKALDRGAGLATAGISKELRETLAELRAQKPKEAKADVVDQLRARQGLRIVGFAGAPKP